MSARRALHPEPCGSCFDTYARRTARIVICSRCGEPVRLCVRCVQASAEYGVRQAETCARCSLEHEMRDGWGPS